MKKKKKVKPLVNIVVHTRNGDVISNGQTASAADFVLTSAGAGDSGKVPKLDASGKLDDSFTRNVNVRTYDANDTWTKPSKLKYIIVKAWGAGGSGGSQNNHSASGGGGGVYIEKRFEASELGATESVTIGNGGSAVTNGNVGNGGGHTILGAAPLLTAYGGGAGYVCNNDVADNPCSGGSGGTHFGQGASGGSDTSTENTPEFLAYGKSARGNLGGSGIYSGSGGGSTSGGCSSGGNSIYGGGGGGGAHNGGAEGTGGTSIYGGNGGRGNDDTDGAAGAVPGGGGGACSSGGNSGAGGKGRMIIIEYFM